MPEKSLQLDAIRIDGGTQQRAEINQIIVGDYAEAVEAGATFPPAVVFHDGADYWLAAGFHRFFGYKSAGRDEMPAEIRTGTLRDAILYSVGDNHDHGLRRNTADKEKAVRTLLADEDWGGRSSRWIADQVKVSTTFVEKTRGSVPASPVHVDNSIPPEQSNTEPVVHVDTSNGRARTGRDGKKYTAPKKPAVVIQEWHDAGKIGKMALSDLLSFKPKQQKEFLAAVEGGASPAEALKALSREPANETPTREPGDEPPTVEEVMRQKNSEIESFCRRLMIFVDENLPDDVWIRDLNRRQGALDKFRQGCETLRTCKCDHVCPVCQGTGDADKSCRACRGTGRMPSLNYKQTV